MAKITNEDLGELRGEVLPERAVLSVMGSGGHGGTTVASACSAAVGTSTPALARMAADPVFNSTSCVPALSVTGG